MEPCVLFRALNLTAYRSVWASEPDDRRTQPAMIQENPESRTLERYRIWRDEHPWSASSSTKSELLFTKKSDVDQSFGFSPFRMAASELERLQREARELARRKAEEDLVEEREAQQGHSWNDLKAAVSQVSSL